MQRGHELTISGGGAVYAPGLKSYLECDGCLLLHEADLREIADYMESSGKKVWRELGGHRAPLALAFHDYQVTLGRRRQY